MRAQTLPPDQTIIVIDHNVELYTRAQQQLAAESDVVEVLESTGPKGLSGARNTGIAAAKNEILAFLDDDAVADPEWLRRLVGSYDDHVVATGGRIIPSWASKRPWWFPEEFDWVLGCTYRGMPNERRPVRNVIGANMSFRRDVLVQNGGFCSDLGRTATQALGDEETEACIMAGHLPGAVVLYEPEAVVAHRVPRARASWKYFVQRCYAEGISKARLSRRVGGRDGLSSERTHVLKTLPAGVVRGMRDAVTGDPSGLGRAAAIVGGLSATVAGYTIGLASRSGRGADASVVPALDRPRVLVVTPRFPPLMGGVENHVLQVAHRLHHEADITVLTTDPSGQLPALDMVDGVSVRRVRAWPRGTDYHIAPGLWRIITHGQWDLVHVQSYHTAVAPLAMLASLNASIPYVVTFHGGGHSSALRNRLRGIQHRALRPLLARADGLIAVARFEAEAFATRLRLPVDRFDVIPNGSDLPEPDPIQVAAARHPLLVSIGRLEEYKGHHRVVEAMPEVLHSAPEATLLVLGSGPYRQSIENRAAELGVADHVEVRSIPAEDRRQMASTLASADLVVLMSSFETHPLAVIESVALGRPALVADTSGLRELADNGLARSLPLDSDASAIATAILDELRSPRKTPAVHLPTWEECAAAVAGVYRRVIDSANSEAEAGEERPSAIPSRVPLVAGFAGCAIVATALANNAGRDGLWWSVPLFWTALLLAFAPAVASLVVRGVSRHEVVGIVAVTSLALYVITLLESPTLFTSFDELLHYRTLDDIARTGRLLTSNPLLPISPYYPGLELVTHALMSLTGLSGYAAGVVVVGIARTLMVVALCLLLEQTGLQPRFAGLGALLYMTAPSFLYFDSQYAYESLALPLAVLALFLLRESQVALPPFARGAGWVAALVVFAIVPTHHVTSYILTGALIAWVLVRAFGRGRFAERQPGGGWVPALSLAAGAAWFVAVASHTAEYLRPHFQYGMIELASIMAGQSQGRRLFQSAGGDTAPILERLVALGAVALAMLLIAAGIRAVRAHSRHNSLAYLLGFAVLAYPASLALRFTPSGWQVGSRAMAFIYVGLAFVLAVGLQALLRSKRLRVGPVVATVMVAVMFAGGVIAGSGRYSRLATPYQPGAGKASIEAEGVSAATWARSVLGPGHRIAADATHTTLMGSYGQQWPMTTADDVSVSGLFLTPQFGDYQRSMIGRGRIEYVVVDRRIVGVRPYQGYFFEKWEKQVVDYGSTVDTQTAEIFDTLPGASRIYDSGNIQVYDVRRLGR